MNAYQDAMNRPYMGTFVRAKYSPITLGLISRTFTVNLFTALAWETMRVLFEVYTSEVIHPVRFNSL